MMPSHAVHRKWGSRILGVALPEVDDLAEAGWSAERYREASAYVAERFGSEAVEYLDLHIVLDRMEGLLRDLAARTLMSMEPVFDEDSVREWLRDLIGQLREALLSDSAVAGTRVGPALVDRIFGGEAIYGIIYDILSSEDFQSEVTSAMVDIILGERYHVKLAYRSREAARDDTWGEEAIGKRIEWLLYALDTLKDRGRQD